MTTATAIIPTLDQSTFTDHLARWHQHVQTKIAARLQLFTISTLLLFAMYLGLNWPHLGMNARLHWDSETSICTTDPMPNAAELALNRDHIYDIVEQIHSSDPTTVTAYFNSFKGSSQHVPLERVRRYYSQISFILARASFNLGRLWFGTPVRAVMVFQMTAMIAVSAAMGLLITFAIVIAPAGEGLSVRIGMLLLAFAAVTSQIIFLSIARQVLTETIGWFFWIPTLLVLAAGVQTRRNWVLASLLCAGVGAGVFLTIRARYNMGPALFLTLPLVLLLSVSTQDLRRQCKRYTALAAIAISTFAILVGVDAWIYGPFFMPWVYDQTLVRSASLYFHSDPPYALFLVMLYNNFPLLLLPVIGVSAAISAPMVREKNDRLSPSQLNYTRVYASLSLMIVALLVLLMARQAVGYQGRHLFALSAAAVVVMLLTLGRVRWSSVGIKIFASVCLIAIAFNLHSTFGPQSLIPGQAGRPITRQSFGSRWQNRKNKFTLLVDLFEGYFEWADDNRLHDPMLALQYIQTDAAGHRPLLVLWGNTEKSQRLESLSTQFGVARPCWYADQPAVMLARVQAARAAGLPVYIFTANQLLPQLRAFHTRAVHLPFNQSALFCVP